MLSAARILRLHDSSNLAGHGAAVEEFIRETPLEELVYSQHRANFDLWHEEDRARDPEALDSAVAATKHSIDSLNQQRNDLVERIDSALLAEATQNPQARLHSETPGLIIDRLSILSLKIFHSQEESERQDATEDHRQRNHARVALLVEQRHDLANALDELWNDILRGDRRFKLYKQMKMYNDPELNPVLYRRAAASGR